MTELERHTTAGLVDPPHRRSQIVLLGPVDHRRLRRDAAVLGHAHELGDQRARPQASGCLEVRPRGDRHAIGDASLPDAERREHWGRAQPYSTVWRPGRGGGEPRIYRAHQLRVALCQVDVGNPPTTSQQVEGELSWVELRIARDMLEIAGTFEGGLLEALDHGLALHFVIVEGRGQVAMPAQGINERNAVLHRQLGAGTDGKVSGVRGVTKQHDVAVVPTFLAQRREVNPERAVRHQTPPAKLWLEEGFAVGDAVGLTRRFQAGTAPRILRALHDEGAGAGIERIGVDLEQAVIVATEDEGEGVERQVASKPHVFRRMHDDLSLEELRVGPANEAIDAIRADDEIGALELAEIADLVLELEPYAERPAAPLKDIEQHLPRDPGKDMPA